MGDAFSRFHPLISRTRLFYEALEQSFTAFCYDHATSRRSGSRDYPWLSFNATLRADPGPPRTSLAREVAFFRIMTRQKSTTMMILRSFYSVSRVSLDRWWWTSVKIALLCFCRGKREYRKDEQCSSMITLISGNVKGSNELLEGMIRVFSEFFYTQFICRYITEKQCTIHVSCHSFYKSYFKRLNCYSQYVRVVICWLNIYLLPVNHLQFQRDNRISVLWQF